MHFSYFYLTFHMLFVIDKRSDLMALSISINQNVSGLVGRNGTHLTCSFTKDVELTILNVAIVTRDNDGFVDYKNPIVIFLPEKSANVLPSAEYLSGRVTLTNMTYVSSDVTMTFKKLNCEDEKNYICTITYSYGSGVVFQEQSEPSRILVKAAPSKPDVISSFIVWSTHSGEQENTSSIFIREGDTVMFICKGNIGKPPGKLIWQMFSPQNDQLILYSNATMDKEEMPENCTFRGTSNLTVHITPDHLNAKYRCFEESQADVAGMYIETEPLNVHFQVNHVDIKKQPNQKQYGPNTDSITLTCKGNGNPEPQYKWSKKGQNIRILSHKHFYVIDNVIQNNSGVYICEVYNIIDDVSYRKSNSVEIDIVDDSPSSQQSASKTFFEEYRMYLIGAIGFVVLCTVITCIWRCCKRQKKKEKKVSGSPKSTFDDIVMSTEYATVIRTNSSNAGETGDTLMVGNKNNSRNKQEDLSKTVDGDLQTTSYHTHVYDVPSDSLKEGNVTCKTVPGFTSFKDSKDL